jgi:hypothetical protein
MCGYFPNAPSATLTSHWPCWHNHHPVVMGDNKEQIGQSRCPVEEFPGRSLFPWQLQDVAPQTPPTSYVAAFSSITLVHMGTRTLQKGSNYSKASSEVLLIIQNVHQRPLWEGDQEVVKRSGKDEPMQVVIHTCMETMLGISLYSYLYLKLAKMLRLSYYLLCFLFNKIGE